MPKRDEFNEVFNGLEKMRRLVKRMLRNSPTSQSAPEFIFVPVNPPLLLDACKHTVRLERF